MKLQKWMWIAWPSFVAAGILEALVFAVVDPQDVYGLSAEVSRQCIYTLAFFCFWIGTMLASSMTLLLALEPAGRDGSVVPTPAEVKRA